MTLPLLMIPDDPRGGLSRVWDAWAADTRGWYTAAEMVEVLTWTCPPGWRIDGDRLARRDARAHPVRGDVWTWSRTRALESLGWESVTAHEQGAFVGVFPQENFIVGLDMDRWLVDGRRREWYSRNRRLPRNAQLLRYGVGSESDGRLRGLSTGRVKA